MTFSLVIPLFNGKGTIEKLLDSIFNQKLKDFEVIIIDNGSNDGCVDLIKKKFSDLKLIINRVNLGAAYARNQGIAVSKGDWILTLDCDCILEDDFLLKALDAIKTLPKECGIIQPKILALDGKTIYSCGIHFSFLRKFYDIGSKRVDSLKFSQRKYVFGACSACALYKKEMLQALLQDTGYFDNDLFFLFEDADLAWRARKKNWKAIFLPDIKCFHEGESYPANKKLRQYLCYRNRYLAISKNEGILLYAVKLFPLILYDLPKAVQMAFTNTYFRKSLFKKVNI